MRYNTTACLDLRSCWLHGWMAGCGLFVGLGFAWGLHESLLWCALVLVVGRCDQPESCVMRCRQLVPCR